MSNAESLFCIAVLAGPIFVAAVAIVCEVVVATIDVAQRMIDRRVGR